MRKCTPNWEGFRVYYHPLYPAYLFCFLFSFVIPTTLAAHYPASSLFFCLLLFSSLKSFCCSGCTVSIFIVSVSILSFLCFFPALAAMCSAISCTYFFFFPLFLWLSDYTADLSSACLYSHPYVSFCFADCTATLSSACFNYLSFFLQLRLHTILFHFLFLFSSLSFYVLLCLHIIQVYLLLDFLIFFYFFLLL